jgi:orotate phosphoribosyltransferase
MEATDRRGWEVRERDGGQWLELLESVGAVQNGHFLLSSGRHSERYVQCAKVLEDPEHAAAVGAELARQMAADVDRVVSPPLGGILVGYEVARGLRRPFQYAPRMGCSSSGEASRFIPASVLRSWKMSSPPGARRVSSWG